ncbi:MAG: hypothetical protein ACJ74H_04770 [Thermoanaerobaculia bacterium]
MKRTSLLLALIVLGALPAAAQSTEFGVMAGGSTRFVDSALHQNEGDLADSTFSFSNSVFELYWAMQLEPEVYLKVKGGRIETQIAVPYEVEGATKPYRRDAEGEVQHAELNVEYRFSEPYGRTGLFAGLGFYHESADDFSATNYGVNAGVNVDFPLSKRYGIVLEGAYHWTNSEFQSRYMTATGGLRVSF